MKTIITKSIKEAADFIVRGGVVAFPTETVYGLAANAFDVAAVAKIFTAKGRPSDNPLIVHCSDISQIEEITTGINENARLLIDKFFPGPLTLVLNRSKKIPDIVSAGLGTVGIRIPSLQLARDLIAAAGVPIAAPSANISGKPSPTTWQAVQEDLDGRIDCILQGEPTIFGLESTVVDCTVEPPVILRSGGLTYEKMAQVVPNIVQFTAKDGALPKSPGLKHKHYSPNAKVVLVDAKAVISPTEKAAFIGIEQQNSNFELIRLCQDKAEYAATLFEFFREADRKNIKVIYCQIIEEKGIGVALMDRLRRAAEA